MTSERTWSGPTSESCGLWGPAPVERRIVIAGNSMPMGLGPEGPGRRGVGPAYPVLVEQALRAAGTWARCIVRSRARQMQSALLRGFEEDVLMHAPEVVILHHGGYEVFSGAIPEPLRRLVYADLPGQGAVELWLRSKLGSAPRRAARRAQILHGRWFGARGGRRSPERAGRELALVLHALRELADDPAVLVLGPTPLGRRYVEAMPGINSRVEALTDRFRAVVDDHGGRASFVDLGAELEPVPWRSADDLHLNTVGHAAVAELLVPRIRCALEARAGS